MNSTNARARYGMTARLVPSSTQVRGNITFGQQDADLTLLADKVYALRAIMIEEEEVALDLKAPGSLISFTPWTAGTAQVETATAAGTITVSGNMTVSVTAAGMTGSPKAISVAVLSGDTASDWAAKVRTALAAEEDVAALFTVGGSTTAITLTRKSTSTYTYTDGAGDEQTITIYAADDATLNIALADDTSSGITEAASSANTTAGVATSGSLVFDEEGNDFEGAVIPVLTGLSGVLMASPAGITSYATGGANEEKGTITSAGDGTLAVREFLAGSQTSPSAMGETSITFTATNGVSDLTLTVFGYTS